jgi:hypothetical protein
MHYATEATYVGDYKMKVSFDNNGVRLVDFGPDLDGPIFEPLKDISYFKTLTVNRDIDTITWPNDADFSPDFLYEIGEPVNQREDAAAPWSAQARLEPSKAGALLPHSKSAPHRRG